MKYVHSLIFKLIVVGVLLVVFASTLRYFYMGQRLKAGVEELVNAHQLSLAKYVAHDIENKVVARRSALLQLSVDLPRQMLTDPARMEAWLREQSTPMNLFPAGLVAVHADGQGAVADYPPLPGRRQRDFRDQDWFAAVRSGTDFAIGKPTDGGGTAAPEIAMAVPVRDAQQHILAVLMGVTPLGAPGFLDLVQAGSIGKTGGLLLVSPRDHIFVTSNEADMRLQPLPAPGINVLHDRAMAGWRGAGVTRNALGSEEISAVVSVPSANWFLVARTPTDEAFQVVHSLLTAVLENSSKVSALVVVTLVVLLTYLFRPLKQAAARMQAMAQGHEALAHLPVVHKDEIGNMVTSFNELVDKLLLSQSRMSYLAHHDALTGLPNRMAFQQNLAQSVALASRQQASLALLFIDLDGFKAVNDSLGHDTGDQLLVQVAGRLRACVRASDMVGRLGGDEFVVLLTDDPTAEQAAQVADKVIESIRQRYPVPNAQAVLGASIGIALYPTQAETADQLLTCADAAMYEAKRAGGDRHHQAI